MKFICSVYTLRRSVGQEIASGVHNVFILVTCGGHMSDHSTNECALLMRSMSF